MASKSLYGRLKEAKSRLPIVGEEREKAERELDNLYLEIQTNKIRLSVLNKLVSEEDDEYVNGDISKKDYDIITDEWFKIYSLLSKSSLKKIRSLIEVERVNNPPQDYILHIENETMKRERKIREFFTFGKYLDRRRHNLEGNCIEFIKEMALKNDAYEFFDALKDN